MFQAKHASSDNTTWGVDGESGSIVDMKEFGIWEPFSVKVQVYKTAVEVSPNTTTSMLRCHRYMCL